MGKIELLKSESSSKFVAPCTCANENSRGLNAGQNNPLSAVKETDSNERRISTQTHVSCT